MKSFFVVLLIFALISALSVYILAASVDTINLIENSNNLQNSLSNFQQVDTTANPQAVASAVSAPDTGDIGVIIAFAVCGATAFVTIKLTRDKNKNKIL